MGSIPVIVGRARSRAPFCIGVSGAEIGDHDGDRRPVDRAVTIWHGRAVAGRSEAVARSTSRSAPRHVVIAGIEEDLRTCTSVSVESPTESIVSPRLSTSTSTHVPIIVAGC